MATHHFNWQAHINIDPEIMGGKPVIMGRRVLVEVILGALAAGDSIQDVCEAYLLDKDDVRVAIAYAAYLVAEEEAQALPRG